MRQNKRIETETIQGKGSFVVIKPPAWADVKELDTGGDDKQKVASAEKLLAKCIVDWNWTDDDGKKLPLPDGDPKAIDALTADEVQFLIDSLTPSRKN